MTSNIQRVNGVPIHLLPDSERLLLAHNVWQAPWDESDKEPAPPDIQELTEKAFDYYKQGFLPIQVRWRLQEDYPLLPAKLLARAQRGAERAMLAAEQAPAELRRAQVALARQAAIQGALAAGEWGAALRGLDRAGEIAGELREASGLSEEDLVLTVTVERGEAGPAPLPAGESQAVSDETG